MTSLIVDLASEIDKLTVERNELRMQLNVHSVRRDELQTLLDKHMDKQRFYHNHGKLKDQLAEILVTYERQAENAIASGKAIVEDMCVYLRSFAMILDMVGNASTHREKDARLRGCVEMVESAIQALRNEKERVTDLNWYGHPDIFRSDYPVREHKRRIYELENEVKRLKKQYEPETKNESNDSETEIPW